MANNILIDLSPLKAGGGVQLAINFLNSIHEIVSNKEKVRILLPDSGPLAILNKKYTDFVFISAPTLFYKRVYFEYFTLKRILKLNNIDLIFTFFGCGLLHPQNIKSVVCVAYPIICYNESLFWSYLPFFSKCKLKIKNHLRIKRLSRANLILAETPIMLKRLSHLRKINNVSFDLLPPSPSEFVLEKNNRIYHGTNDNIKFLFLSGVAPHKNLWRLPELANELKNYLPHFKFVISSSKEIFFKHLKSKRNIDMFLENQDKFDFVGTVFPTEINKYYEMSDFLVSLSDLESFSNNYIEAWKAGIPLIVSDRDFSRNICKESALYVEPHNPKMMSLSIFNFINNVDQITDNVSKGKELLSTLPDSRTRTYRILKILNLS